ncbi:MAG: type IV toxin-antitoxin system AbiEi family antitoxin domain-containing protein [Candidatus Helarchaeota archaeon]
MNDNIYLTRLEQEIFTPLVRANAWILTSDQVKDLFFNKDPRKINRIISNLRKKGYLYRLQRKKYLIQDIPSEKPLIKDPYRLGLFLFEGYLAFSTALRIYDLIDYEKFTIFIATWNISRTLQFGEYLFKAVALGRRAVGITHYRNYYVSTLEKTIYDCLTKPQFSGGYAAITQVIHRLSELNWDTVQQYIERYSSDSMAQKIGYILDLLNTETDATIPRAFLHALRRRVKGKTKLLSLQRSIGKYNRKWKLLDNLGKEKILSWWYYG